MLREVLGQWEGFWVWVDWSLDFFLDFAAELHGVADLGDFCPDELLGWVGWFLWFSALIITFLLSLLRLLNHHWLLRRLIIKLLLNLHIHEITNLFIQNLQLLIQFLVFLCL